MFIALFQLLALPISANATSAITEFPLSPGNPQDITLGPDGAMWFRDNCVGNCSTGSINRITDSGIVTSYPVNTYAGNPILGPDGAFWFTNNFTNKIERMTTSGVITDYSIPITPFTPDRITGPVRIAVGSDGALWFTDYGRSNSGDNYSNVGRITTSGDVTIYSLPGIPMNNQPYDITAGPDGALWFTEPNTNHIGRITVSGEISEYAVPTTNSGSYFLTAGSDGALWFSEQFVNKIGRITTSGNVTEYPVPNYSFEITSGPDGALWFTEPGGSAIGRITTSGVITEYPTPTPNSDPIGITAGPNNTIWFSEVWPTNQVGRINITALNAPSSPIGLAISSPTKTPILNWGASSNAASYNIYRNGANVGSGTSTTFTDNNALEGTNSYYVTAVNAGGESDPSNSVNVLVDQTAPTITYSLSQAPSNTGWNNGPVTIRFSCADSSSGIAACSSPVTLLAESANQVVTGTATDNAGNTSNVIATVNIDETVPTITYSVSPAPNANGWNNGNVLVNFNCNDALSGIATCTSPVILNTDGANQTVTGTATDNASNTTSIITLPINIDTSPPSLGVASWSKNPINTSQSTILTVPVTDGLSGVTRGEYFLGSVDPGHGNATGMTLSSGNLTANFANLAAGVYTINYRAEDAAGNWDLPVAIQLTVTMISPTGLSAVTPTNNAPVLTWNTVPTASNYQIWRQDTITGVNTLVGTSTTTNFTDTYLPGVYNYTVVAINGAGVMSVPSIPFQIAVTNTTVTNTSKITAQAQSTVIPAFFVDTLPGLTSNNSIKATFDFSVGYPGGTFTVTRPLTFTFNAGGHKLFISSSSIDWLVVSGEGSSLGTFQGLAAATLDNVTTTGLPFSVTAQDGTKTTPMSADNFKLTVYTNSSRTTVLYSVNAQLSKGKVKIN